MLHAKSAFFHAGDARIRKITQYNYMVSSEVMQRVCSIYNRHLSVLREISVGNYRFRVSVKLSEARKYEESIDYILFSDFPNRFGEF